MIPGPVEVDEAVLAEMAAQVVPHYGSEWVALYTETTDILKDIFHTKGDVFLLVSSGTGGVEAAIGSLFATNQKIIVTVNGFFGQRIATIARHRGLEVILVQSPWGEPIDPITVRTVIQDNRSAAGLVAVHHETSTGVLNPVKDIGALCKEFGLPFVVDAVSSLGGEELFMDAWGIDICITSSNKCLESLPGLAPIAVSSHAWDIIDRNKTSPNGWYLNLGVWREYAQNWADWHPYPVTMATSNVRALRVALDLFMTESLEGRIARYRDVSSFFRRGLKELGFELYVDGDYAASVMTAVRSHPQIDTTRLITALKEKDNIRIAGGLGEISGTIFRVAHMGKAGSRVDANLLLDALGRYLNKQATY